MRMNVGSIIVEKRKEKKITQQELADFIGVSKASVSKWETNQTYPDITLLPLLAAYFDISIDSLLNYEPQLSHKEIQHIYQSLKKSFETQPSDEVLTSIRSLVRRYYSCYSFVLQMGLLLLNYINQLPEGNNPPQTQKYLEEIQGLFVHVRTSSNDPSLIDQATKFEAYILLMMNDADQVLAILGEQIPPAFPVESLIAAAFQIKGENDRAIETQQNALFQYIGIMMSLFTNYSQLLINQPEKFRQTVDRAEGLAEVFDLPRLHPMILINFWLSAAVGFVQQGKVEASIETLKKLTNLLEQTTFPLVLHGDEYFDQMDRWFESLETGNELPRNTLMVKDDLIEIIINNPIFSPLKEDENYQSLVQRLKKILGNTDKGEAENE